MVTLRLKMPRDVPALAILQPSLLAWLSQYGTRRQAIDTNDSRVTTSSPAHGLKGMHAVQVLLH